MLKLILSVGVVTRLSLTTRAAHWPLDSATDATFTVRGKPMLVDGTKGTALSLASGTLLEVKDSAAFGHGAAGFSLSVWVNPFAPGKDQQMIAGKNRYSANEREWGLMLDRGGRFRLYVWQGAWKTTDHKPTPKPGQCHQVGVRDARGRGGVVGEWSAGRRGCVDKPGAAHRRSADLRRHQRQRHPPPDVLRRAGSRAHSRPGVADGGKRRAPLTIAVTRPGDSVFSKVFVIRHAAFPEGPGESHERASLSYPCAVEHDGHLYVGYSNNGGNVGCGGTGRELWNNNSAELAVIPVASLAIR